MRQNKTTLYILIVLTFLTTAISFRSYFKYAWYDLDDYYFFDFVPAGTSVLQAGEVATAYLYHTQKRFQPVRIYVSVAFTHFFEEEQSAYYNFALHLINILLLFLLLRKFNAGSIFSLISVLLFAVFGRFRYMNSSIVMIGGSGLNLFFILTAFLFLIKSLENSICSLFKRYAFLAISFVAYGALVFSYEVAVPLFVPLIAVFYLFNPAGKGLLAPFKTKKSYYLFLYLFPLSFSLIFFKLLAGASSYDGAHIDWSTDILVRLKSYIDYTLLPPFQTHGLKTVEFLILALYFAIIIYIVKKTGEPLSESTGNKRAGLRLLLFSAVFYPSTVVIFTINHWMKPTNVMIHHTYIMTAASALLVTSFFYCLQWILFPSFRKKYLAILILFIFPVILINGERHTVRHYRNDASRVIKIRTLKNTLKDSIPNIEETDAIILKNFHYPYYSISSIEGAFLKWSGFSKHILSGREITSVRGDEIIFKGPLHLYLDSDKDRHAANNRVRIFFIHKKDGVVLPYHEFVDLERGLNLYQTEQVKEDCPKGGCADIRTLEVILSNFKDNNFLNIWFKSSADAKGFLKKAALIEVNDMAVPPKSMTLSGDRLSIDVSKSTKKINYFFLHIISRDDKFKESIRRLSLTKTVT